MDAKQRTAKIITILKKKYPKAKIALDFKDPLEILVATILSAQCTDKRVNIVTKGLFKKYKKPLDYAKANLKKFESEIKSTGFYKNKAKNIINACKRIIKDFKGQVPTTMKELVTLPGVARKTANIVLYSGFGKIEGIAVDTHVKRISTRLELSRHKDPVKIEQDLMKLASKRSWGLLNHLLVTHGRQICDARRPLCSDCVIADYCPSRGKFNVKG